MGISAVLLIAGAVINAVGIANPARDAPVKAPSAATPAGG
jgi:hypothetical protein